LLVENDNLESLVDSLDRLIVSPELRRSLGRAARKRVAEDFNLDIQAEAYFTLYQDLLRSRRSRWAAVVRAQVQRGRLLPRLAADAYMPDGMRTVVRGLRRRMHGIVGRLQRPWTRAPDGGSPAG
jgi:hypothetical protein